MIQTERQHWRNLFDTDYFGAYLWKESEAGRDKLITIDDIRNEQVISPQGKKSTCPVAHLRNGQKPLVLNKTNCKTLEKLTGSKIPQDWIGTTVAVYVQIVDAYGEKVEAVRIRNRLPNVTKPKFDPSHKSWDKAIESLKSGNTTVEKIKETFDMTAEVEGVLRDAASANEGQGSTS